MSVLKSTKLALLGLLASAAAQAPTSTTPANPLPSNYWCISGEPSVQYNQALANGLRTCCSGVVGKIDAAPKEVHSCWYEVDPGRNVTISLTVNTELSVDQTTCENHVGAIFWVCHDAPTTEGGNYTATSGCHISDDKNLIACVQISDI